MQGDNSPESVALDRRGPTRHTGLRLSGDKWLTQPRGPSVVPGEYHRYYYTKSLCTNTMASATVERLENTLGFKPGGDIVGGVVLAILGVLHLFVFQLSGVGGLVLFLMVWPLVGGVVGTLVEETTDRKPARDPRVTAALSGVFGSFITVVLVFLTGVAGLWTAFIHSTFGTELLPVSLGALILLTISWTVLAFIGGFVYRRATAG